MKRNKTILKPRALSDIAINFVCSPGHLMCYACVMTKCQHLRLCCFVLSFRCLRCTMGVFLSSYLRWEMEETPQYYLDLEEDRWMRFYFFCVAAFFGCRFGSLGEGWWLEKNLADWRWMNEGPCWQERVWDWGCSTSGNVRDCVLSSFFCFFFLFLFFCSGERWYAGQRWIALMSKVRY